VVFGQAVFGSFGADAAQALTFELDAVRIVDETIEDGVGVGGIADDSVPGRHGELRRDDRRSAAITLFEDFEEVMARAGVERLEAEVVEDQEIRATKGFEQARMAPAPPAPKPCSTSSSPRRRSPSAASRSTAAANANPYSRTNARLAASSSCPATQAPQTSMAASNAPNLHGVTSSARPTTCPTDSRSSKTSSTLSPTGSTTTVRMTLLADRPQPSISKSSEPETRLSLRCGEPG
jgi:hypothetical protein